MVGYGHPLYAASLAEFGRPRHLSHCGGWLLERPLASGGHDAMGCYPLFQCSNWDGLTADLADLGRELVSVVFVADPLSEVDPATLATACNHGIVPFKEHCVVDLEQALETQVCSHHRRNARRALRVVQVERVDDPANLLDAWCQLYAILIERHTIQGISAFTEAAFARQLATPGLRAFRARAQAETIGILLFYQHEDAAHYHLGAFTQRGYEWGASFALFWTAFQEFRGQCRWLSLGAGAGTQADHDSGLARFKRGWSRTTRTAWLCRHIGDPVRYHALAQASGKSDSTYFPAYREGEFARREVCEVAHG